jgi:predicted site-specific integrase-resolvase
MKDNAELLLPSAAGRVAGVSATAIRQWIRCGRLPALTLSGGVHVVRRVDLEMFLRDRAAREPMLVRGA